MNKRIIPSTLVSTTIAGLLLYSTTAIAGAILSPVAVIQNTLGTFASIPANSIDFTHDGSGLPAFTSGVTDFNTYMSIPPAHSVFAIGNAWASAAGVFSGVIDYDLGAVFTIDQIALWNQNVNASQGVNSFDILTSKNAAFVGATNVGSFNAADTLTGQSFILSSSVGQYVRLQINSHHGASCCVTLGEIALDVSSVPEPTTLVLVGLGLAGLAFARKRLH